MNPHDWLYILRVLVLTVCALGVVHVTFNILEKLF